MEKVKKRIFTLLIPVVLIAAAFVSMLFYQGESVKRIQNNNFRLLRNDATKNAAALESIAAGRFYGLRGLAATFVTQEPVSLSARLRRMRAVSVSLDADFVAYSDNKGNACVHTGKTFHCGGELYFTKSMKGKDSVVRLENGPVSDAPCFLLSIPVMEGGKPAGMLCAGYSPESFRQLIRSVNTDPKSTTILCDGNGTVLTSIGWEEDVFFAGSNILRFFNEHEVDRRFPIREVTAGIRHGRDGVVGFTANERSSYAAYVPVGIEDWMLVHVVPGAGVDAQAAKDARSGILIIVVIMGISLLLLLFMMLLDRRWTRQLEQDKDQLRKSEAQARYDEKRLQVALENTEASIWEYDFLTGSLIQSAYCQRVHGFDTVIKNVPESMIDGGFISKDSAEEFREMFASLRKGEQSVECICKLQNMERNGWRYERMRCTNVFGADGKPYRAIGVSFDITEQYVIAQRYEREVQFKESLTSEVTAMAVLNLTARIVDETRINSDIIPPIPSNISCEEFYRILRKFFEGDSETLRTISVLNNEWLLRQFEENRRSISREYLKKMPDGTDHWFSCEVHMVTDSAGRDILAFFYMKDIDTHKRELERLLHLAQRDALTGLLNHAATEAAITKYLSGEGSGGSHAFLMIDLDHFKEVNDILGHQQGDATLARIGGLIRRLFRADDITGRIGGDEFLVLMKNVPSRATIIGKAAEVCDALQFVNTNGENSVQTTVSIGIALVARGGKDFPTLYAEADKALYSAKSAGRNRFVLVDDDQILPEKQANATERSNAIQLRALLQNLDVGVILLEMGEQAKVLFVSPSFYRATGRAAGDMEKDGEGLLAYLCPDDRDKARLVMADASTGNACGTLVYRTLAADGDTYWRQMKVVRIEYPESAYPVVMLTITDITALKRSQQALQIGHQRLHFAFDQTKATIWEVDIATRVFQAWDTKRQSYDPKLRFANVPESFIDNDWVAPESVTEFTAFFHRMLSGEKEGNCAVMLRQFQDRNWAWSKMSFRMMTDGEGKSFKAIGIAERLPNILGEKTRFEQEDQLNRLMGEHLPGTMCCNLTRDRILRFQCSVDAIADVTAGWREESYSRMFDAVLPTLFDEEDIAGFTGRMHLEALKSAFEKGSTYVEAEYRQRDGKGGVMWASHMVSLLSDPVSGDLFAFCYLRDVSHKKRLEAALPSRPEYEAATMLYDNDTTQMLIETMLRENTRADALCALALLQIDGLDVILRNAGYSIRNKALFLIGRLFISLLGDKRLCGEMALIGYENENHLALFLPEVENPEEAEARTKAVVDTVQRIRDKIGMGDAIGFRIGIALGAVKDAVVKTMYAQAAEAIGRNGEKIALFQPTENFSASRPLFDAAPEARERKEKPAQGIPPSVHTRDPLTGLPGYEAFYSMLRVTHGDELISLGVVFLDFNGLSGINRRYGNDYGDRMVRFTAETLLRVFQGFNVFRVSGHELIVLCRNAARDGFYQRNERMMEILNGEYPGSVSAGYTWSDKNIQPTELVDHAESLMRYAKQAYLAGAIRRGERFQSDALKRLVDAFAQKRYLTYLQPKASAMTGEIVGAEALARLSDPDRGILPPSEFVGKLEEAGLIRELDLCMLEQTLALLQDWRNAGRKAVPVSVNFSRATLLDSNILPAVLEIVGKYTVPVCMLEIEITETIGAIEQATITRAAAKFQQAGFRLSLDDFGSRYSSLSVLGGIRFDSVKLDKSLVDTVLTSAASRSIVENVVRICNDMQAECIAEGVETEDQMDILRDLGCTAIQGYFINKPLAPELFERRYL